MSKVRERMVCYTFSMSPEMVGRIKAAAGSRKTRSQWVREAVSRALAEQEEQLLGEVVVRNRHEP